MSLFYSFGIYVSTLSCQAEKFRFERPLEFLEVSKCPHLGSQAGGCH